MHSVYFVVFNKNLPLHLGLQTCFGQKRASDEQVEQAVEKQTEQPNYNALGLRPETMGVLYKMFK